MVSMSKAPAATKLSRGRQRIEIKRRENVDDRRVTFTKRRTGLFDKGAELCVLCGAKVAILTFSEGRKAFTFGNPEVESVLEGYLRGRSPGEIEPSGAYFQALNESNQLYLETLRGLEREKLKWKSATVQLPGHTGFWWDTPVDDLGCAELEFYHNALEKMMGSITAKIEEKNPHDIDHGDIIVPDDFVPGL